MRRSGRQKKIKDVVCQLPSFATSKETKSGSAGLVLSHSGSSEFGSQQAAEGGKGSRFSNAKHGFLVIVNL